MNTVYFCFSDILKLKTLKGLALEDILQLVHTYVHRSEQCVRVFLCVCVRLSVCVCVVCVDTCSDTPAVDFPPMVKMTLLEKMADLE